nr:prepilin-type N-terminal cleavage/methylation domain-containing protein [uncultured Rhodoferax sp.]
MLRPHEQGFSLLELMVALTILGLLLLAGLPSFSQWLSNAKVRSAAEEIANGLRTAQAEAMRRNRLTAFVVTNQTPGLSTTPGSNGINWYVQSLPLLGSATTTAQATDYIQGSNYGTQGGVTITSTDPVACFGSLGNLEALTSTATNNVLGVACTATAKTYSVSRSNADRTLNVTVSIGGQVRLCDPSRTVSTTNPDGC